MGGVSDEHDVSLNSGTLMIQNLDAGRFQPMPILISRENIWMWPENNSMLKSSQYSLNFFKSQFEKTDNHWKMARFPLFNSFPRCDIFLLALHGKGGEDGRLQGFLDILKQPYTGSGSLGSALAMDKIWTKKLFEDAGIPTPEFRIITAGRGKGASLQESVEALGLPLVLKVPTGGSSLGLAMCGTLKDLRQKADAFLKDSSRLLAEKFIGGREASCGFLENFKALPPTEIIPIKDSFFSYEAKYQSGMSKEVTPGDFPDGVSQTMQALAEKCHHILGLSVYSRTDFILSGNSLNVLESNSLPGFTETSLLPQQAMAAGLDYSSLLTKVIEESLKKR